MDIKIRKAEKQDTPRLAELLMGIAALHHRGRPDIYAPGAKYTAKDMEKKLKNKDEIILVAVNIEDYVLGYAMSKINIKKPGEIVLSYKSLYIDDVCVDEKFRHMGIGKALMEETVKAARKEDCHNVELNVWDFNQNAVKFYESCGMRPQRHIMEIIL